MKKSTREMILMLRSTIMKWVFILTAGCSFCGFFAICIVADITNKPVSDYTWSVIAMIGGFILSFVMAYICADSIHYHRRSMRFYLKRERQIATYDQKENVSRAV